VVTLSKSGISKSELVIPQRRSQEYFINKYYADPIARIIVRITYKLRIHPNLLTLVSLICGVLAAGCFLTERSLAGAILVQVHLFFDLADGTLARLTHKATEFGAKLDKISDQIVRGILFPSIAIVSPVSLWVKIVFVVTIYLDVAIVHLYVLPFLKKKQVIRSPWKKWFLERGIIPGFDIFLVFVLISLSALIKRFDLLIYIVIIGKNLDWMYRVWECRRSIQQKNIGGE
jgi:phosphatidylglycerophosphate synthase